MKALLIVLIIFLLDNLTQVKSLNVKKLFSSAKVGQNLKLDNRVITYIKAEDDGLCLAISELNIDELVFEKCKKEYRFQWRTYLKARSKNLAYIENYTDDDTSRFLYIEPGSNKIYLTEDKHPMKYKVFKKKFNSYTTAELMSEDGEEYFSHKGADVIVTKNSSERIIFKFTKKIQ